MIRLEQLEEVMRPQFVWDRTGLKLFQTSEVIEGSKDLARMIFVGIADMYGFDASDVQVYLDMQYPSYRHKLTTFRAHWREAVQRVDNGDIDVYDDPIKKFYHKTGLCLNAIRWKYRNNPYLRIEQWMNYE